MTRETSIEVYTKIKNEGLLSQRRWEVYHVLVNHGPLTSSELFEHYKTYFSPNFRYNLNVHSRLNELKKLGLAVEVGTKQCSMSGNTVLLWQSTNNLPSKSEKKPTKSEIIQGLQQDLISIQKELNELRTLISKEKAS